MSDYFKQPICDCIRPIINKYISIRKAAEKADNPDRDYTLIIGENCNSAIRQYAHKYLMELLDAEHENDCPVYREILGYVEISRQMCLIEKAGPKTAYEYYIGKRQKEHLNIREAHRKKIIERTSELEEPIPRNYWVYLNCEMHLHMYEWPEGSPLNKMGLGSSHKEGHYITFKGKKYPFPYFPNELFHQLDYLEKKLKQDNLGATDLQEMPIYFFEESELKDYPEHAKLVYNIIEEIALYIGERYHNGRKDRVINDFLKHCEERALQVKAKDEAPAPPLKYAAKFYALYHLVLIELGIEKPFEKDEKGQYDRATIEIFAENRYPGCSKQGFYKDYRDLCTASKIAIAGRLKKGYKEKIIAISGNDGRVASHLKSYPD